MRRGLLSVSARRAARWLAGSSLKLRGRNRKPFGIPEVVALGVEVDGKPHRNDGLNGVIALRHGLSAAVAESSVAQAIPDVHRVDAWRETVDQSSPD
jgi:hypothetical protein